MWDKWEENISDISVPLLKDVDYMLQQMANYENHLFDERNELADLCVNIQPIATNTKKKR